MTVLFNRIYAEIEIRKLELYTYILYKIKTGEISLIVARWFKGDCCESDVRLMFLENPTSVPFRHGKIGPQKKLLVFSTGL